MTKKEYNITSDLKNILLGFLNTKNNKKTRNDVIKKCSEIMNTKYDIPYLDMKVKADSLFKCKPVYKRIMYFILYKLHIAKYLYKEDWFSIIIIDATIKHNFSKINLNND